MKPVGLRLAEHTSGSMDFLDDLGDAVGDGGMVGEASHRHEALLTQVCESCSCIKARNNTMY